MLILPIFDNSDKLIRIKDISLSKNITYHFVLENYSSRIDQKKFEIELFNYKLNNFKSVVDGLNKYFI
jgi:hypothetical protein